RRSRRQAKRCLSPRVARAGDGDRYDVLAGLSAAHPADDHAAWLDYLRREDLAVVTLTVTEAGYLRGPDGRLDTTDPRVRRDVAALAADLTAPVSTVAARLVAGLAA